MKVALLTRAYPPDVHGGAGAHGEFLARRPRAVLDLHAPVAEAGAAP